MQIPSTIIGGQDSGNEFGDFSPEYIEVNKVSREAMRFVFFPGDVIELRRKREHPELNNGGEEGTSVCLVRTRKYIQRGRFVPVEKWGEPMPSEMMPEGVDGYGAIQVSVQPHGVMHPTLTTGGQIVHFPRFPGDEIHQITGTTSGDRKGLIELTSLVGVFSKYEEFVASGLQDAFFPDLQKLPPTLRELQRMIDAADSTDSLIRTLKAEMLAACADFRVWGMERIQIENNLLAAGTMSGGWVPRYSGLADVLLPQLEMQRQDEYLNTRNQREGDVMRTVEQTLLRLSEQGNNAITPATLIEVMQAMQQNQMQMMAQFAESNREAMVQHGKELAAALAASLSENQPAKRGGK